MDSCTTTVLIVVNNNNLKALLVPTPNPGAAWRGTGDFLKSEFYVHNEMEH